MQQIQKQTTQAGYIAAATIEGVWDSPGGYYSVIDGEAFMEIQYAPPGQGIGGVAWTNEVLVPVGNGNLTNGTTGVRFRDAGSSSGPAVVTAVLSAEAEPLIIVGAPGAVTTTPSVSGIVTGLIPATGTLQTAGTGFTYTHVNGSGVYVFTFTPSLASAPGITVQGFTAGNPLLAGVSAVTAAGFQVDRYDNGAAHADGAFFFVAEPIV